MISDRSGGSALLFAARAATSFDVLLGLVGSSVGLPGYNAYTAGDVRTKTWSVFGDFTFDFTDQLSLSVGGRYTNDKRDAFVYKATRISGLSPEFGGAIPPMIQGEPAWKTGSPLVRPRQHPARQPGTGTTSTETVIPIGSAGSSTNHNRPWT